MPSSLLKNVYGDDLAWHGMAWHGMATYYENAKFITINEHFESNLNAARASE